MNTIKFNTREDFMKAYSCIKPSIQDAENNTLIFQNQNVFEKAIEICQAKSIKINKRSKTTSEKNKEAGKMALEIAKKLKKRWEIKDRSLGFEVDVDDKEIATILKKLCVSFIENLEAKEN